ncbi:zinc finger BED domain-containing protein RICESLEEPER 2-like [Carya illinoinensis]|uniref:zinc finger BED domain-containing protein RICESLEEPER 2-like n=1 Tax=Carya illinoinensis TaxID=32201 RepID=UPI001C724188|nr:zinc finger BED domain-containing protein RICESLEEPER 2-like [Carya illinoinensis]
MAHFIDNDWNLNNRIINLIKVSNHKGATIGEEIESSILQLGIKKIFTIIVNNASSNQIAIDYLRRRAKVRNCIVLDNEFMYRRCCTHILNLIVNEGLKEVNELVVKVRNAVKYMKSSPARPDKFKLCADKQNILGGGLLCLDVPTRWNSTYLMLTMALKYGATFDLMQDEYGQFVLHLLEIGGREPKSDNWKTIDAFVSFLKIFYDVTLQISRSTNANSNFFIKEVAKLYRHLNKFSQSVDKKLAIMSERMLLKYNNYWGDFEKVNKILFIATMLDPRSKLEVLEFWFIDFLGPGEHPSLLHY